MAQSYLCFGGQEFLLEIALPALTDPVGGITYGPTSQREPEGCWILWK